MTRSRIATPAIPFIFLHGLNGETITTTPTPIEWDHAQIQTSDFHYDSGGTRITVLKGGSGIFRIQCDLGCKRSSGNALEFMVNVYINGVGCPCGSAHGMMGAKEHSDVALTVAAELKVGDYVEIYVSVDVGTGEVEEDTGRLILQALPTKGWDNSRGGTLRRRGGVDR